MVKLSSSKHISQYTEVSCQIRYKYAVIPQNPNEDRRISVPLASCVKYFDMADREVQDARILNMHVYLNDPWRNQRLQYI